MLYGITPVLHASVKPNHIAGVQLGFGRHIWDVAPLASIFDRIKSSIQVRFWAILATLAGVPNPFAGPLHTPNPLRHRHLPCQT